MEQPARFIGMDVHKDTIVVAVTAAGDVEKAMPYGTFPNTAATVEKLVRRLRQPICYLRATRARAQESRMPTPSRAKASAPSPKTRRCRRSRLS
jgi:hypothetical protein